MTTPHQPSRAVLDLEHGSLTLDGTPFPYALSEAPTVRVDRDSLVLLVPILVDSVSVNQSRLDADGLAYLKRLHQPKGA